MAAAAWVDAEVVFADWVFTVPAGVVLPLSGLLLAWQYGLPLTTPWVLEAILGYAAAGLTWLPAAGLQLRMRRLSAEARRAGAPLPPEWRRAQRTWALLGLPSFGVSVVVVWVMVSKSAVFL